MKSWGSEEVAVREKLERHLVVAVALCLGVSAVASTSGSSSTDRSVSSGASLSSSSSAHISTSSAMDRPLPTVAQLVNATDCDTLNMLMTGVLAVGFRFTADVTLEEYDEVGGYDEAATALLAEHHRAFTDASTRLECSDAESDAVFDSWYEELCQAWKGMGHHENEVPLFANTAFCPGGE